MGDASLVRETFQLARDAANAGSRPFGALIAREGRILCRKAGEWGTSSDPTAHPEMEVIRAFCREYPLAELRRCSLFTNVEPCPMCAGAIYYSGIARLVYSVSRPRFDELVAALRHRDRKRYRSCREIIDDGGLTTVSGPVLEEEGLAVLSSHLFLPRRALRAPHGEVPGHHPGGTSEG
jgi:tRNA(Arg) A34 adenosine deaminase TadA